MKKVENKADLKKRLLEYCMSHQKKRVETAQDATDHAQESANEEESSSEEKFESFRAQMQLDRDMFAQQLNEAINGLNILRKIELDKSVDKVSLGAVVITNAQQLFISINIGQVKLEQEVFYAISTESPLCKAMMGKKKGDSFSFRDKTFEILDIF